MKLHWSPRSPFVRKVMILAHETGLEGRLQLIRTVVAMAEPNHALLADNPLSKIPTLVLDDGVVLYDSRVICEYLDHLHDGPRLFPLTPVERWQALRRQALGDGILDVLLLWRNERMKPRERQTQALLDAFELKVNTALRMLEREAPALNAAPFDIGHIGIGCALSYIDFRFPGRDWRASRPQLTSWHRGFQGRPSVQRTEPTDQD